MRRDQRMARTPQLRARIRAQELVAKRAENNGDMTKWDDARREIKKLRAEIVELVKTDD